MKLFRILLISHATYILITAVWPLLDIHSFMMVTGPKTDIWLVKTVGALLIPVGLCMLSFLRHNRPSLQLLILAVGTAISFIAIDVHYAVTDVISNIYLADAVIEFFFLLLWLVLFAKHRFGNGGTRDDA